jgi:hypothetical protein
MGLRRSKESTIWLQFIWQPWQQQQRLFCSVFFFLFLSSFLNIFFRSDKWLAKGGKTAFFVFARSRAAFPVKKAAAKSVAEKRLRKLPFFPEPGKGERE